MKFNLIMSNYSLQTTEVILYNGDITIQDKNSTAQLLLTNLNVVVSSTVKKNMFSKSETVVDVYPVNDIKIYNEEPQIKQKGNELEIYFLTHILTVRFDSKMELSKFKMAALKLLTGKSIQERGAEKVKGAVNLINDTLGIDTFGTVKGVLENGVVGSVLGGVGSKSTSKSKHKTKSKTEGLISVLDSAKELTSKNNETKTEALPEPTKLSHETQIEALKKYKELLDNGIITEEEFSLKKKEVLNI